MEALSMLDELTDMAKRAKPMLRMPPNSGFLIECVAVVLQKHHPDKIMYVVEGELGWYNSEDEIPKDTSFAVETIDEFTDRWEVYDKWNAGWWFFRKDIVDKLMLRNREQTIEVVVIN